MTEFSRNQIVKLENKMDTAFKLENWGNNGKGLVYPNGNVYMWGLHVGSDEHINADETIKKVFGEKNKPIFSFYFWANYSSVIPNCVTTSVSNQPGFYPKFLRRHDDGKITDKKLKPILDLVPADWICFSDAYVNGKTGVETPAYDGVNDLYKKIRHDYLSQGEYNDEV